ncbi:hypothetical protein [Anabaena azotica]|uniref:Uncharacterized protein n=1 Tax=Anabaena azotica FACHB-119 TaxID=947527 RepID=A0ABR8D9S6_9NOST|nr:hypothetical protein [Anabaena azotica]MBD2503955.1 hypothetical protein [Anabaena azotica FACHB-119]
MIYINTNIGIIEIEKICEETRKIAKEYTGEWDAGDEVILVILEDYGGKWVKTEHIKHR